MQAQLDTNLVCIDFETVELLPDGSTVASADFWKSTFRVASCAFTWYDGPIRRSKFVKGEAEVGAEILKHIDKQFIVFNLQFESGVVRCRYPNLKINWYVDVMRLAQLYDGGGGFDAFDMVLIEDDVTLDIDEEDEEASPKAPQYKKIALSGFGLSKAARRIIGSTEDHKAEAHNYIYTNVPECKKGKAGQYLDRLPDDIMERYNIADTETTFDLYEFILTQFRDQGYDWTTDHTFYKASVESIMESEIRGIPVNRDGLLQFKDATVTEIRDIGARFRTDYQKEIATIEYQRRIDWILGVKTAKGQRKRYLKWAAQDADLLKELSFNPGSNKQLASMFKDLMGIKPIFFTPKNQPSFKSAHLHQWGDAGKLLLTRRKRLIAQKQAEAILKQSAYDGRLHVRLRAVGTKTGRYAGAGGVNIQALSRREKELMNKLLPDPGYIFVSSDMSAGEPTIITQLTKDPNYRYFCFDGIGKKPYYKGDTLMIDDVYLGYASKCPLFSTAMRNIFDNMLFEGKSFVDQWLINAEVIKETKEVKFIRKNAKWMALAFGYGLGPKNVVPKAIEAGLAVKPSDGKCCFDAYWSTFNGIRSYANQLAKHTEAAGWFTNHFGYRFVPEQPRKAFNGMIQSSVSSLFHWYFILMKHFMPEALYVCCVHDEGLFMIKEGNEDKFRLALKQVADTMNRELGWDVDLRFGAVFGKDLYEAK